MGKPRPDEEATDDPGASINSNLSLLLGNPIFGGAKLM
jgi:hypothetical protein